jgi:hypothetical protein
MRWQRATTVTSRILLTLSTLSAARLSLEDLLTRVASFAVNAIPGADGPV